MGNYTMDEAEEILLHETRGLSALGISRRIQRDDALLIMKLTLFGQFGQTKAMEFTKETVTRGDGYLQERINFLLALPWVRRGEEDAADN